MKASLKIEAIGDDVRQMMRLFTNITNELAPGLGDITFGKNPFNYWVARITGTHPAHKYERYFLRSKKDYSQANRKGSRGVFLYFLLESGFVYEVKTSRRRYYCTVTDKGDIVEVDQEYVNQWINDHSESTS